MTELLAKAFEKVSQLPPEEQDGLAGQALEDLRHGRTEPLGSERGFMLVRHARQLAKAAAGSLALVTVLCLPGALGASDITVGGGCSLTDAIRSANTDSSVGECTAGSEEDTIHLAGDVVLAAELPEIGGTLTIEGGGFTVSRDPSAPAFRIFSAEGTEVTYRNLTVTGGSDGDGIWQAGGIWDRSGVLTLENTTITGNEGNGVFSQYQMTVESSTISDNTGSGIYAFYAILDIRDSTISGNDAVGLLVGEFTDVVLTNSTVSGNDIGVANSSSAFYPYVHVLQSTFAGNRVGFMFTDFEYSLATVESTVLGASTEANCSASFVDLGNNFADDPSCGGGFSHLTGLDITLADNGGPTETHALIAGSSAIDAASSCELVATDQRGFLRHDGACDSGAFELGGLEIGLGGVLSGGTGVGHVRCSNRVDSQFVTVPLDSMEAFDCEAAGLDFGSGDTLRLTARDVVGGSESVGGVLAGMSVSTVRCSNRATGEQVVIISPPDTGWDCEQAGLKVAAGDTVYQVVSGVADPPSGG